MPDTMRSCTMGLEIRNSKLADEGYELKRSATFVRDQGMVSEMLKIQNTVQEETDL